jgi:hypothetical protein
VPYSAAAAAALDCDHAVPQFRGPVLKKQSSSLPNAEREQRRAAPPAKRPRASEPPARERRSAWRVDDEQQSGQGSLTALSKMKMLERKRAAIRPDRDEPPRILD